MLYWHCCCNVEIMTSNSQRLQNVSTTKANWQCCFNVASTWIKNSPHSMSWMLKWQHRFNWKSCPPSCRSWVVTIPEMISEKRKENYLFIASWIRRKISFALVNSRCTCLRGNSLFTTLQTHTQRIHYPHYQRLAKLPEVLMQLYNPFDFYMSHTLHITTAMNVI